MSQIPIIDFSLFNKGDISEKQNVVKQIYQACHEIGFIYIANSGISPILLKQVFEYSKYLFNLPLEVKQNTAWRDEFSNQGYVGIERERLNPDYPGDLKEAFNIFRFDNFPTSLYLSPAIPSFYKACTEIANNVLAAFSLALKLPEDFFSINHNQQNHTLRLLHYPPLRQLPKIGQIRAGEHSDYGSITLLFQDDVGGLEVQTATGKWIAAPKIADTILVNTGDLMQRWTNDVFCSTKHRVIIPGEDKVKFSRYSMAFFCHPNKDTEISCLESCKTDKSPIYPPITAGEYLLNRLQATY
ncbi:dioxygenase, isopenicillin N synthase [Rivularia sp. PCC 7116]|uniref:isopenicillin N synthase family dioxygenase n=1 Tax=Rivularia sp. PCC 7116 TaxID=373994 RepID=UPI00029EEF52|nr:2OG-Fe(II) oxygenase family protein [Rivularia sp. PCC 7116]AFY58940.1 dioxygenase, isopenicillin N synthase [Rivularia sp. PCC 7116]